MNRIQSKGNSVLGLIVEGQETKSSNEEKAEAPAEIFHNVSNDENQI